MGGGTGTGGFNGESYHPHPNLNDAMSPEQQEAFRRFMTFDSSQIIPIADDGRVITIDKPISMPSIEHIQRMREERDSNLGS